MRIRRGYLGAAIAGAEEKGTSILDRLPDFMTWGPVKSGQVVNYETALKVTAVLACCQVLANGLAQVPWRVMKAPAQGGLGASPDSKHPLYKLINRKPNSWQTSFEYRETIALHLALARNHFSYISRGAGGRILELIPLEPGRVEVLRGDDLTLRYRITGEDGRQVVLPADQVWHIRGLSWNGWMGMETVRLAAEAIGLCLALEEAHARLHGNGVQPSGTWSVEGKLTEEQHVKLTAWIKKHATGAAKFDPLILDNGAKWLQQQMSGVDAEHLATRSFQVLEICRAFNVQPMMIFAVDKPTYGSAEQLFIAHVVHTMAPLWERIEQSADVHLLGVEDDTGHYTHFDEKSLLRGSMKDLGEFIARMTGAGGSRMIMTQDEARDRLDLPPKGGTASQLLEPAGAASSPPADTPKPEEEAA